MPIAIADVYFQADRFIKESLVHYDQRIAPPTYPEYWGYNGLYHRAIPDLQFGQTQFNNLNINFTGKAVNYGGKAQDIPMVNYNLSPTGYKTMMGTAGATWTFGELEAERTALRANLPAQRVVPAYREAMDRALQTWMHLRTVFGDPEHDFTGIVNNPYIEVIPLAGNQNPLQDGVSDDVIAENLYTWGCDACSSFKARSKLTMGAGIGMLTSENINRALKYRFQDGSGTGSVRDLLLGLSPETKGSGDYKAIKIVNEMAGEHIIDPEFGNLTSIQGVTIEASDDLVLLLDAQPGVIRKHYHPIQYLPVQNILTEWKQVGFCAVTEAMYPEPLKARLYVLKGTKRMTEAREFSKVKK